MLKWGGDNAFVDPTGTKTCKHDSSVMASSRTRIPVDGIPFATYGRDCTVLTLLVGCARFESAAGREVQARGFEGARRRLDRRDGSRRHAYLACNGSIVRSTRLDRQITTINERRTSRRGALESSRQLRCSFIHEAQNDKHTTCHDVSSKNQE